jgi:DNA-binding CsgD family transcriptional regulator
VSKVASGPDDLSLLEREREVGRVAALLDIAARGEGAVVVIRGVGGVGKTAMLATACALAAACGADVLRATAGMLEGDLAWNLVRQLFVAFVEEAGEQRAELLAGAAALAAPALGLGERSAGPSALHGLYWLLARLALRRPLLLAVDDAHWGDDASLRWLAYLAERVADLPVLVALTVRDGEREGEALRAVAADPRSHELRLHELSAAASARIARRALGEDADDAFCAACHRVTNGNPFLLSELVAELRRDGVEPSSRQAEAVAASTPASVTRALLVRLERLGPDASGVAGALAILGDGCALADAAQLAGVAAEPAAAAADALASAGILRAGRQLAFVHPLVRAAVYDSLPTHQRDARHRRAARQLAAAGRDMRDVAAQLLAAGPAGDSWTVARLREAAAQAASEGAPGTAASLLERALAEPPSHEQRIDVLVEAARALAAAGRPGASSLFVDAQRLAVDPSRRAAIAAELGRTLFLEGRADAAAKVLRAARRELRGAVGAGHPLETPLHVGWLAVARVAASAREEALRDLRAIAARPPSVGGYPDRALLAQVAGQLTFDAEPRARALELARVALGDGLVDEETADGVAWPVVAGVFGWCDDYGACEALCEQAADDARARGSVTAFATASFAVGMVHYFRGEVRDALADSAQAIAAERDGWSQFLVAARALHAHASIERGDLAEAAAQLAAARQSAGWEGSTLQALVLEAEARLRLVRGDPASALAAATEAGRLCGETAMANPAVCAWRPLAAVATARLGDRDHAEELLAPALVLARRFGAPRALGTTLLAVGRVRTGKAARDALEEAVDLLGSSGAALEHARALAQLGAELRRQGNVVAAREQLRAAIDRSAALGASALEAAAHSELTVAGGRLRRRRTTGVQALTPAELRVVELAAAGASNRDCAERLFVSLRTIETHLTSAYRKLGITARSELAAMLAEVPVAGQTPGDR